MEQGIGHLVGIVIGIFIVYWYISYQCNKEKEQEEADGQMTKEQEKTAVPMLNVEMEKPDTRKLVVETLKKMGCEYIEEENGTSIRFSYQGENFVVETTNEWLYIDVLDPWWYAMPMDGDIEDFARMQKAINRVNAWGHCNVFYTFNEKENMIGLHCRKTIVFVPEIRVIHRYLAATLDGFFKVQRDVLTEMERSKVREEQENM